MTQVAEQTRMGWGQDDNAFYVGKTLPAYALGKQLTDVAPTVAEGIKLAGLDWQVSLQNLQTVDGTEIPQKAVIRSDNQKCLGVVSDRYRLLQNTDAFTFFEPFVENGLAHLDAAGSLYNGRKVFILAKIDGDNMVIDGKHNDQVKKYILLSNSHDGSAAVKIGFTSIRISCANTLTLATTSQSASNLLTVYHKGNIVQSISELRETMNLINQTFMTTEERYKALAEKGNIKSADLRKYVNAVFSKDSLEKLLSNETAIPEHEISNARKKLMNRVEEVFEMEYAKTAWTAYNAVNYYLNHDRSRSVQNTYNSLWFGDARKTDLKALQLAEQMF